jgi:hypothetical protein
VKDLGKTVSCNVASSAVNRRKAASTIAQVRLQQKVAADFHRALLIRLMSWMVTGWHQDCTLQHVHSVTILL